MLDVALLQVSGYSANTISRGGEAKIPEELHRLPWAFLHLDQGWNHRFERCLRGLWTSSSPYRSMLRGTACRCDTRQVLSRNHSRTSDRRVSSLPQFNLAGESGKGRESNG